MPLNPPLLHTQLHTNHCQPLPPTPPRRWSPDGLSVLLVADFRVRLTVWSLVERKPTYLPGPKHYDRGIAFSPRGDQLAVLEVMTVGRCWWECRKRSGCWACAKPSSVCAEHKSGLGGVGR